jgi:DNA-binding transcriptional ArsR family regulator
VWGLMDDRAAAKVAHTLSHPIRIGYLRKLRQLGVHGRLSPVTFADSSDEPLATVAYHVRVLFDAGVIEVAETVQRRGAKEHRYSLSGPRADLTVALMDLLANG